MTASSPLPVSQNQTIGNSTLTDRITKDEDDYDTRKMFIQVSVVFAVTCGLILRSFYTVCWEEKQKEIEKRKSAQRGAPGEVFEAETETAIKDDAFKDDVFVFIPQKIDRSYLSIKL